MEHSQTRQELALERRRLQELEKLFDSTEEEKDAIQEENEVLRQRIEKLEAERVNHEESQKVLMLKYQEKLHQAS